MHKITVGVAVLALACSAATANFFDGPYTDCVTFSSDLQPAADITLPAFDGSLGTLVGVSVTVTHSGSAEIAADNDDPLQSADVNARIIRQFSVTGPGGLNVFGGNTVTSPQVALGADDGDSGDVGNFDDSAPDGHFFGVLSYANLSAGSYSPLAANYEQPPANVTFTVTPVTMVNDLQFVENPDAWQLEVQNPLMEVCVSVTYEYIPEPSSLLLLAAGLPFFRRR